MKQRNYGLEEKNKIIAEAKGIYESFCQNYKGSEYAAEEYAWYIKEQFSSKYPDIFFDKLVRTTIDLYFTGLKINSKMKFHSEIKFHDGIMEIIPRVCYSIAYTKSVDGKSSAVFVLDEKENSYGKNLMERLKSCKGFIKYSESEGEIIVSPSPGTNNKESYGTFRGNDNELAIAFPSESDKIMFKKYLGLKDDMARSYKDPTKLYFVKPFRGVATDEIITLKWGGGEDKILEIPATNESEIRALVGPNEFFMRMADFGEQDLIPYTEKQSDKLPGVKGYNKQITQGQEFTVDTYQDNLYGEIADNHDHF